MKGLILSGALALAAVGVAAAPASADCRTVQKTVYSHGVKKVVTKRSCDSDRRVVERRVYRDGGYRHHHRDGIHLGIGIR